MDMQSSRVSQGFEENLHTYLVASHSVTLSFVQFSQFPATLVANSNLPVALVPQLPLPCASWL